MDAWLAAREEKEGEREREREKGREREREGETCPLVVSMCASARINN